MTLGLGNCRTLSAYSLGEKLLIKANRRPRATRTQNHLSLLVGGDMCMLTEKALSLTGDDVKYSQKGIYHSKNHIELQKEKI